MKTKILMALLCLFPLFVAAQNYEQQGDELYAQAQYEKAEKKYKAAIEISGASSALQSKKEKCAQCAKLLKQAISAEESSNYTTASNAYAELFAIHALPNYKSKADALQRKADTIIEQQRVTEQARLQREAEERERAAQAECERKAREYIPVGTKVISKGTFENRLDIKNIIIPNGVTSIGNYAFSDCKNLTSVTIPNSVTSIGYGAFRGCSSLTSVTIPNSVTNIGNYAFEYCSSLTSVTIPNSATSIGDWAFSGCENLISIEIPNSVTCIGNYAFSGCKNLTSVTIPNNVTSIGYHAFEGCKSLTSVTIPNSVTNIGESAFKGCRSLTSVTIPNSVTSIERYAFSGVANIVYNGIATGSPWGARNVNAFVDGWLLYRDNTKTTLLTCSAVATGEITIPNSVTSIGQYAFSGCSSLTSVTIPNSVTSIGWGAFNGCNSITSITIPKGVRMIASQAFNANLQSIEVSPENQYYSSEDGVLFNKYKSTIILYPKGRQNTSYTIPNSIRDIGKEAFRDCKSLTSVTIPSSVTNIGNSAFQGCKNLTSVTIPNSVIIIEDGAFRGCNSLTLKIPQKFQGVKNFNSCKEVIYY